MQLENVLCEVEGRAVGGCGLLTRFLVALFAATILLSPSAAVLNSPSGRRAQC